MAKIPATILQHFIGLSDYERKLAVDKAARDLGMTVDQIEAEIESFQSGGFNQDQPTSVAPTAAPQRKSKFKRPNKDKEDGTDFVDDSHRYRFKYDPSHSGQARQTRATQAIVCPTATRHWGYPTRVQSG